MEGSSKVTTAGRPLTPVDPRLKSSPGKSKSSHSPSVQHKEPSPTPPAIVTNGKTFSFCQECWFYCAKYLIMYLINQTHVVEKELKFSSKTWQVTSDITMLWMLFYSIQMDIIKTRVVFVLSLLFKWYSGISNLKYSKSHYCLNLSQLNRIMASIMHSLTRLQPVSCHSRVTEPSWTSNLQFSYR